MAWRARRCYARGHVARRQPWRYQLFQALYLPAFFVPVVVLFWEENGLDRFDIYLLQGLFAVAVLLLEVPTGLVANRLGKKRSLIWGAVGLEVGFVAYGVATSFWAFLVGEVIIAVGVTLLSGADAALLYDTLDALGRRDEFKKIEGRARAIQMTSLALCSVAGGFVGEHSYRATVWMTAIGPLLALLVAAGLKRRRPSSPTGGEGTRARRAVAAYAQLIRGSLRFVRRHRLVRWYIMFFAVITGSGTWLLWLYQPYMQAAGLPIWAFGFIFAGLNLAGAAASHFAHRFDAALGATATLVALALLQILSPALMAVAVTSFGIAFALGQQAVRGMTGVIVSDRILRFTYADRRATVLSLQMLGPRLFFALTAPAVGWVARAQPLDTTLLAQVGLLGACLLALLLAYRRVPAKYHVAKTKAAPAAAH